MKMNSKSKTLILCCIGILLLLFSVCIFALQFNFSEADAVSSSIVSASSTVISSCNSEGVVSPQNDVTSSTIDEENIDQENTESETTLLEDDQTESTLDTNHQVSNISSVVSSATHPNPLPSNISNGEIVYANPIQILPPKEADFGEYYDYALDMYNQFKSGNFETEKQYEFPHLNQTQWDAEVKAFFNAFQTTCLKDVDSLIPRSTSLRSMYHQTLDSSSGETKIMLYLDENYFQEYQKIMWVQDTIQSIVGNGVTEKTVVDQITNWCIGNCSYNYNYQYAGVYRNEYTIVHDLLQNKKGICNDFARLLCFVCDLYGIQNEYIATPEGRENRHAWNRVCVGDTWYYIDVTWCVCDGFASYSLTETLWENHEQYL